MGKLSGIKPRLGGVASRFASAPRNERERDKQRRNTQPWRSWYKTARWEKLRQEVFLRDRFTCQRTGALCNGKGHDPYAPVANHKVPHRGDPVLFWDKSNIETVAKHVHDSIVQAEEAKDIKGVWY